MGQNTSTMPNLVAAEDWPLNTLKSWRALSAEFLATMMFIYVAAGTVIGGGSVVACAMAFGLTISVLVHGVGHISGGHINPAVTVALTATQRIHWKQGLSYIGAQLLGAMVGGFLLWGAMPETTASGSSSGIAYGAGCNAFDKDHLGAGKAFLLEFMGTFLLVFTVFATIDSTRASTDLGPLQIGFAVGVAHLVGIPQTGTGINPARSFGTAVAFAALGDTDKWKASHTGSDGPFDGHWVYFLAPIVGSLCAAFLYDFWFDMDNHGIDQNLADVHKKRPSQIGREVQAAIDRGKEWEPQDGQSVEGEDAATPQVQAFSSAQVAPAVPGMTTVVETS